jgi:hypothetical protein
MISAILRSGRACPPGSTPKHGNPSRQRRCRKDGPVAIANALPDTAVVAVCDTSRYVVSLLKKYAGVQTFTHYQEMIDEARPTR